MKSESRCVKDGLGRYQTEDADEGVRRFSKTCEAYKLLPRAGQKKGPKSLQKTRGGTQTDVNSASITTSLPVIPSTSTTSDFLYEPPKQGPIQRNRNDDVGDNYVDDDDFVEVEAMSSPQLDLT